MSPVAEPKSIRLARDLWHNTPFNLVEAYPMESQEDFDYMENVSFLSITVAII